MRGTRAGEFVIVQLIRAAGFSAIIFVGLILVFLAREGGPALLEVPLDTLLAGRWYPIEGFFGLPPLLGGTLLVTLGATAIAAPLGVLTAVYVAEVAPRWAREVLKPLIELLAGIPSVALGFIGILAFVPVIRTTLGLPTGLSALTGAILLGLIAIPTIVSVAEDAIEPFRAPIAMPRWPWARRNGRRNAEKLQHLIDQLLELSQMEAETIPLHKRQHDIIRLVKLITSNFFVLAQQKNINLQFSSPLKNVIALIDQDKLEKIINNLIVNAIKFTPSGGNINVQLTLEKQQKNDIIIISRSDTGIGIPEEQRTKIFDRFYQIDDSSKKNHGGAGIGFSTC